MVLYIEALRDNTCNYVRLAKVVRGFIVRGSDLDVELGQAIGTAEVNVRVLNDLLAQGMTELEVPEIPR